jgi:hypothetical protein
MSVIVYFRPESMNVKQYDDIRKLEDPGEPKGRLYHVCFSNKNNLNVVDIWETTDNFNEQVKILMPILGQVGVNPGMPEIEEIHSLLESKAFGAPALAVDFMPRHMNKTQYNEIMQKLDQEGSANPDGRILHISYGNDNNIRVFGVWDSKANYEKFGKILMPIVKQVGVEISMPEIMPIYNVESKILGAQG